MLVFDQLRKSDPQLRLLAMVVFAGMLVLFAGLWWVQIVNRSRYQESLETQSFRTVRLPAVRGKILDRNGVALAENRPNYNVSLYLEELSDSFKKEYARSRPRLVVTNPLPFWKSLLGWSAVKTQFVRLTYDQSQDLQRACRYRVANGIVARVSDVLKSPLSLDSTNFSRHFNQSLALPFPVATNITELHIARFAEQSVNSLGVDLEIQSTRIYPQGATASHVLGYLRHDPSSKEGEDAFFNYYLPDYRGLVGIEGGFDAQLRGRAGAKSVTVNNLGYRQTETVWSAAEPGQNVVLTLDLKVQKAAENSLHRHAGLDGRGAVVVMDVTSGDVLALVSTPATDPNNFIRGFSRSELDRWHDNELGVQKNRATQEQYQAGSIFKTMVALAALENGLNPKEIYRVEPNPQDPAHGAIFVNRQKFKDTVPPGDYDLRSALMRSSNSYFITNGLRRGVFERVVELGQRLHLGERIGLPLMQEAAGHFPKPDQVRNWAPGNTANICIGQGYMDVTPMQVAVMTSALANGGTVLKPRLVDRLESQDPADMQSPTVYPKHQVRGELGVSERSMKIVREAMLAETEHHEGTGYGTFREYYATGGTLRVCGKTGTAEREEHGIKKNTTWFISFAPYETPRFAVVVMVENGVSGGATCAPVARDVYVALKNLGKPVEAATAAISTR